MSPGLPAIEAVETLEASEARQEAASEEGRERVLIISVQSRTTDR